MLGGNNQKVIPISTSEQDIGLQHDEVYDGPEENFSADVNHLEEIESLVDPMDNDFSVDPTPKKFVYKKLSLYARFMRWYRDVNYDYIKETARWLTESATIDFSISFEDIVLVVTIYILFADDIKMLSTTRDVDDAFSNSYAFCFFLYLFEWLFNTWCKTTVFQWYPFEWEGYFLSFFWWADLISTLSICPDILFIAVPWGLRFLSNTSASGGNYTQAGRVVRLIRLVRLVRVYRIASERSARREHEAQLFELARVGAISYEEAEAQRILYNNQKQSKLGKQLSESITRRVIFMIIILLVVIPLLIYAPDNLVRDFTAHYFHGLNNNITLTRSVKQSSVNIMLTNLHKSYNDRYVDYLSMVPTYNTTNTIPYINYVSNLESLRDVAKEEYYYNTTNTMGQIYSTDIIFNTNSFSQQQAYMDIITTIFVAIMMIGGAVTFSNDAERLVIKPIERMMNLVEAVAANPLAQFSFDDDSNNNNGGAGQYETKLLESTVEKITALLRVGFGEAGAGIISANLSAANSSSTINPLLPGMRIYAMFGFCDIHHFEDINQKLANDVLTFVNTIAEIVHENVHTWSGQCNKNLGNAFVIVWRIGDEVSLQSAYNKTHMGRGGAAAAALQHAASTDNNESSERDTVGTPSTRKRTSSAASDSDAQSVASSDLGGAPSNVAKKAISIDLRRIAGVDILADHALISYLKIIAEINRNKAILKYRTEPRLTDNGKHEYKLRMGFGLHAGWAIEGAVGSIQKVDATYLSPHVNMAARLETSSRQYGVPLLASQDFYDLLSSESQQKCRRLDVVTVKGSEVPIGIYTYDCVQEQYFLDPKTVNRQRRSTTNLNSDNNTTTGTPQATPKVTQSSRKSMDRKTNNPTTPVSPTAASSVPPPLPSPGAGGGGSAAAISDSKIVLHTESNSAKEHGSASDQTNSNSNTTGVPPLPPMMSSPGGSGTASPQRRPSLSLMSPNSNALSNKAVVFMTPQNATGDIMDTDYDLLTLRAHITPDFLDTFKAGVNLYLSGEWNTARNLLERTDSMMLELAPSLGGDGPSKTLLNYMRNFDFVPPKEWHGFRPLTAK